MRAYINHSLKEPQMLHPRITAVRAHGTLVRHRLTEVDASILEAIDPWKYLCPNHAAQRIIARIGATIVNVTRSDRRDHPILVQRNLCISKCALVSVGARDDVFCSRLNPLYGSAAAFF